MIYRVNDWTVIEALWRIKTTLTPRGRPNQIAKVFQVSCGTNCASLFEAGEVIILRIHIIMYTIHTVRSRNMHTKCINRKVYKWWRHRHHRLYNTQWRGLIHGVTYHTYIRKIHLETRREHEHGGDIHMEQHAHGGDMHTEEAYAQSDIHILKKYTWKQQEDKHTEEINIHTVRHIHGATYTISNILWIICDKVFSHTKLKSTSVAY